MHSPTLLSPVTNPSLLYDGAGGAGNPHSRRARIPQIVPRRELGKIPVCLAVLNEARSASLFTEFLVSLPTEFQ